MGGEFLTLYLVVSCTCLHKTIGVLCHDVYVATETFTASTRSLSELSSALPSDGAPLQSQHQLKSSLPPPSLPSSANKHTPTSTSYRRVRKRL